MTRLLLGGRAKRDLSEIGDYIAVDNPRAAVNFVRFVREHCDLLKTLPLMGRARPDIGEGIRSFPYRSYLIYYRYREDIDRVQIVRIWHGSRRPPQGDDLG